MPRQDETTEDITEAQRRRYLNGLRFPPALERAFRRDYDRKVLPGLRGGLLLLLLLFTFQALSALALGRGLVLPVWVSTAAISVLLLASLHPRFPAVWQPSVFVTFCVLAWLLLSTVVHNAPPPEVGSGPTIGSFRSNTLLLNELQIVIVGFALTRLRFVWFILGSLTISVLTVAIAAGSAGVPFPRLSWGPGSSWCPR